MEIPVSTQLSWEGTFNRSAYWFTSNLSQALQAQLVQLGFVVNDITDESGLITDIAGTPATFSITVTTKSVVYASEDDVQSLIDHAIYQTVGFMPTASSITDVTLPQTTAGGTVAAGTQVTAGGKQCSDDIWGWISGKLGFCAPVVKPATSTSWLSSITSSGTMYIALVIFGFIAALALIGYSGAAKQSK